MNWREERKENLEKQIGTILVRLGEYETELIDETDPSRKSQLRKTIVSLREQMNDSDNQLSSLEDNKERHDLSTMSPMARVTYTDISFVISALLNQDIKSITGPENFNVTYPETKMSKNDLTGEVKYSLRMGLAKAGEVRHFIENNAKINFPDVPERLKNSLNTEYSKLATAGVRGDDLFKKLHQFSHQNDSDISRQLAGLAVLCYFFETCDVFEP